MEVLKWFNDKLLHINIFSVVSIVFSVLVCIPIFNSYSTADLSATQLAHALHEGNSIKTAELFSIITTLPMLIDILAELATDRRHLPIFFTERIAISLSFCFTLVISLFCKKSTTQPYIFAAMYSMRTIYLNSSVASIISKTSKCHIPMLIMTLFECCGSVLYLYHEAFDWMEIPSTVSIVLLQASKAAMALFLLFWFRHMYTKYFFKKKKIEREDWHSSMYVALLAFHALASGLGWVAYSIDVWSNYDEDYVIFLLIISALFTNLLTTIPGRFSHLALIETQHLLALKRTFVRYVSHEVRSPLGVLLVGLDLLVKDLDSQTVTESFASLLIDMHASSQGAMDLLNDLLNYESIDAGTFSLEKQKYCMVGLLKDKLTSLKVLTRSYELKFDIVDPLNISCEKITINSDENITETDSELLIKGHVRVDVPKLANQVIRNLVTNGAKFTKVGGCITIKFSISEDISMFIDSCEAFTNSSSTTPRKYIGSFKVEVIDTGAGIAKENFGKVFGEFVQINKNSLQEGGGSGLGLWICRKVLALHGGVISFSSDGEGCGANFFFFLPIFETTKEEESTVLYRYRDDRLYNSASVHARKHKKNSGGGNNTSIDVEDDEDSFTVRNMKIIMTRRANFRSNKITPEPTSISQRDKQKTPTTVDVLSLVDEYQRSRENVNSGEGGFNLLSVVDDLSSGPYSYQTEAKSSTIEFDHMFKNIKTLIVDDSAINRKFLRKLIESEKSLYTTTVYEMEDGKDVLDLFDKFPEDGHSFNCIFIDNYMKTVNGPATVTLLRGKYRYTGAIIGVTGNGIVADMQEFLNAGADTVLLKPVNRKNIAKEFRRLKLI